MQQVNTVREGANPPPGDLGGIAYTSNQSGSYDIWLYRPKGHHFPLTQNLGADFSMPYWSRDSKKIAFIGRQGILHILDLGTGSISRIDQIEPYTLLDWSPDNQTVSYVKENQIVLYQTMTHQVRPLPAPGVTDVQWFPSGKELLFQAPDSAGVSQLYRMRLTGTDRQQITQNTGERHNDVRLSPDGSKVLFTSPGASISIISTIDLTTGQTHSLEGGPLAKNYFPAWAPNSDKIAYSATAYGTAYYSLIETDIPSGGMRRSLALSSCYATPITWSPSGDTIAYLSGCRNEQQANQIWLKRLQNPDPTLLILTRGTITAVKWSPSTASSTRRYTNQEYRISFLYPSSWRPVNQDRYEGVDGFFQIAAISSDQELSEVCRSEAFHQLMPYGSKPQIRSTKVNKQDACLITPSADQPAEMNRQAALIAKYPRPIIIRGTLYQYFILWADRDHIQQIAQSLTWI